jgi:hypothetical protein
MWKEGKRQFYSIGSKLPFKSKEEGGRMKDEKKVSAGGGLRLPSDSSFILPPSSFSSVASLSITHYDGEVLSDTRFRLDF